MPRGLHPITMKTAHAVEGGIKNLIWIIIAAVIAIGGYMIYSGQEIDDGVSNVKATAKVEE
jgi:hypothetical protein